MNNANKEAQSFVIKNCKFRGNTATESAGVLFCNGTSLNIMNSFMSENTGPVGSAIYFDGKLSFLHITHSKFHNNTCRAPFQNPSSAKASAIYVVPAKYVHLHDVVFQGNCVSGGIILGDTRAEINQCLFQGNTAVIGGALSTIRYSVILVITNTSFLENKASTGAVMCLRNRLTIIQSCNFQNNMASTYPQLITVNINFDGKTTMTLRSYNNTFLEQQTLLSLNDHLNAATLYLWKSYFQLNPTENVLIDEDFVHNASKPKIVDISPGTNLISVFSQFASGL